MRSTQAQQQNAASAPGSEATSGRYQRIGSLGGGGMALVYDVLDRVTGRRVAQKRPVVTDNQERTQRARELFAREFHTLSQLAHPRIVEVFDYGVDEEGPYYTMELLDGGDLEQMRPLAPKRAYAIARDVCSALSLLHSRRIVHRDISPRNVRCTDEGLAKLIDFGAMARMGPIKDLVGTPVYCAPEVLNLQPLDGRADLYALGATLYYVLTGHHAYPVADFAALPNAWQFAVARPSELVAGIPLALDDLILDLLQLDPLNRPNNAAEVMERLGALEGNTIQETLLVAQSYLATPAFVGREIELASVHVKSQRAQRGHGSVVVVRGPPGVGRSRFLDQSVLAAKLLGLTVIRADADDAAQGDYGVMRRLLQLLRMLMPERMAELSKSDLPVLGHVFPELCVGQACELRAYSDANALRPQLQEALRKLIHGFAEHTPLLIAVDDLQASDEPSLAALAVLARDVQSCNLLLIASAETGLEHRAAVPFKLFLTVAHEHELQNLSLADAQTLLASVFGNSPQLDSLARRLYAISAGAPRDLMRLAQHLVDRDLVKYQAGAWSLPEQLASDELPSSVAHMLVARARALAPTALELACALALCSEKNFSFDECLCLSGHDDAGRLLLDLSRLARDEVVRTNDDRYVLAERAWVPLLASTRDSALGSQLHRRLAEVFSRRPDEEFRRAHHLLRAGDTERALDLFVGHAIASRQLTNSDPEAFFTFVRAQPLDWPQTYAEALDACQRLGRPLADAFALRVRLGSLLPMVSVTGPSPMPELVEQLRQMCGLSDWQQLDPSLEPGQRIAQAFALARRRYDALPAHERILEPRAALRELTVAIRYALGVSAPNFDIGAVRALPSLKPFIPIAPALVVIEQLVAGVHSRLSGRLDEMRLQYEALLATIGAPDRGGLEPSAYEYTRLLLMSALGMVEAALGLKRALVRADELECNALFLVNAMQVRMQYYVWQADPSAANERRKQVDVLRLQNSARQTFENSYLVWQLQAYALTEDLTRLKQTHSDVLAIAERLNGWRPVETFGRAEYQRIRGDHVGACATLELALHETKAGDHQVWPQLIAAKIRALEAGGFYAEAVKFGVEQHAAATRAGLGSTAENCIMLPLCVVQARAGHPEARANADAVIAHWRALESTGLNLMLAFEARAWVAVCERDREGYARCIVPCELLSRAVQNPALSAKLQKLKREAQRADVAPSAPTSDRNLTAAVGDTMFRSRISSCTNQSERGRIMLALLAQHSGASEGHLYQATSDGPVYLASLGGEEPDGSLCDMVKGFIEGEIHARDLSTDSSGTVMPTDWSAPGELFYRPVLLSHYEARGCLITGMAVLLVTPGQPFSYPGEAASRISRMLSQLGDSTGILVDDD